MFACLLLHKQLSGKIAIMGIKQTANEIMWANNRDNFVHSAIKAMILVSPILHLNHLLYTAASQIEIPTLFLTGSCESERYVNEIKIAHPIYVI